MLTIATTAQELGMTPYDLKHNTPAERYKD